jgi:DNA-directed RNA polymerase subunit RPC12/RpoP/predicted transcriptional regulator
MRKVFLDNLPHGGSRYVSNNRVNWQKSIGYKIPFIYDNIEGELEIINYDTKRYRLTVLYNGKEFNRSLGDFIDCKLASILGLRLKKHKYQIGEKLSVRSGYIKIIDYIDIKNGKKGFTRGYTYYCLNCNYQNNISEGHLKEGIGCPVCANQVVKIGVNDMWTTNQELAKLLNDSKDGYKFMQNSNLKTDWKCAECENIIRNKSPSQINYFGLSCPKCSDKISYPEKITYNLLSQLNTEFETQKIFKWSDNKRYDFYINNMNVIIEVHGGQHYEESCRGRTLIEEKGNDRFKERVAKENGISKYIVIDARYSELEHIKKSLLDSELSNIFDLSNINWLLCHQNACKSLVKVVCDLWNDGVKSTTLIGSQLHLERSAIRRYLQKGVKLGWCDYSVKKVRSMHLLNIQEKRKCKVVCLNTNEIYDSIQEAAQKYNVSGSKITANCRGNQKTSGKHPITGERLVWMYYDQYIKQAK